MARGTHVHAVATQTPHVAWCPFGDSSLTEEESTKKVPEYLLTLAKSLSFEDGLLTDSDTLPGSGIATNTLEALDELGGAELGHAFASIDNLESVRPAPSSVAVRRSGVVPAGRSLGLVRREVIPPPPRRPSASSFAFTATLDAFTLADVPFQAAAANQQDPVQRPSSNRAATRRAAISRSVASALFALFALFVLFVVGARPLVTVQQDARTAVTAHARADRSEAIGVTRARRSAVAAADRSPTAFVADSARPSPARGVKASAGRIIRTSPF